VYDLQILVDYYNGRRKGSDPAVQREFQLLKQQAEIDWREMYAGKGTPETPENMAEDYLYHVRATAKWQRTWKRIKVVAVLAICLVAAIVYAIK
jgi:hypothetical protein